MAGWHPVFGVILRNTRMAGKAITTVQARTVTCQRCHRPFVYLWDYVVMGAGVAWKDQDRAEQTAGEKAEDALRVAAELPLRGRAPCPHCRHVQRWMHGASDPDWMLEYGTYGCCFGCLGLFAIAFLTALVEGVIGKGLYTVLTWLALLVWMGGCGIGAWLGALRSRKRYERDQNFLSRTVEAWGSFREQCQQHGRDPVVAWFGSLPSQRGAKPPERLEVLPELSETQPGAPTPAGRPPSSDSSDTGRARRQPRVARPSSPPAQDRPRRRRERPAEGARPPDSGRTRPPADPESRSPDSGGPPPAGPLGGSYGRRRRPPPGPRSGGVA